MERSYITEKDWITSNGLRAVVLILLENGCRLHRCGYVGVPEGHSLYLKEEYFSVHGGITYWGGGSNSSYPIPSNLWWFGFDCDHAGDARIDKDDDLLLYGIVRDLDYVVAECEKLAEQIGNAI
jgi:hypothetical protein